MQDSTELHRTSRDRKWSLTGLLILVIIVPLAVGGLVIFFRSENSTRRAANESDSTDVLSSEEFNNALEEMKKEPRAEPSLWSVTVVDDEVLLARGPAEEDLIVAQKDGTTVRVTSHNIRTGVDEELFVYEERYPAENSGNTWEGMPPSVAVAPDRNIVAYADTNGLHLFDRATMTSRDLIVATTVPPRESERPPTWEEQTLQGTYGIVQPAFSRDGKMMSFTTALYEGAGHGMVDVQSGNVLQITDHEGRSVGGATPLVWSPTDARVAKANTLGYQTPGLFRSTNTDVEKLENIAPTLGLREAFFYDVVLSPDGQHIAFTYGSTEYAPPDLRLAVCDLDGRNLVVLRSSDRDAQVFTPEFSLDGKKIFYVERSHSDEFVLSEVDIISKIHREHVVLPNGFIRWDHLEFTTEGIVVLTGRAPAAERSAEGGAMRLFMLDLIEQRILYASSIYSPWTIAL